MSSPSDLNRLAEIIDGPDGKKAKAILRRLLDKPEYAKRFHNSTVLKELVYAGIVVRQWNNYVFNEDYTQTVERLLENPKGSIPPADVAKVYAAFLRWKKAPLGQGHRVVTDYVGMVLAMRGQGKLKAKNISRMMGWGRHMNRSVDTALSEFRRVTGWAHKDKKGFWCVPDSIMFRTVVGTQEQMSAE
jgi:hypothetical protein